MSDSTSLVPDALSLLQNKLQEQVLLIKPNDITTWPLWLTLIFAVVITVGMEGLSVLINALFQTFERIPVKGKHLDAFENIDWTYISINKLLTVVFVFHVIQMAYATPTIKWGIEDLTLANTLGSFIAFYFFYDLLYAVFHRILHLRQLYPLIHKHHHRQKAPSRGNLDAINVHPFEFLVGEYIHLLMIYVIPCHILTVIVFILIGGILASLNHTRYDAVLLGIYSVKVHDVHHRIPESNYGQYFMFWDWVMGTYRPYSSVENVKAE